MARQMIPSSHVVQVSTKEELTLTVSMYVSQGFQIIAQGPSSVSLIKRKEFKIAWAVVGFLLCTIPLFAYLIYYALVQKDELVEVRLASPGTAASLETPASSSPPTEEAGPPPLAGTAPPQLSADGMHWWDGTQWHRVSS